MKNTMRPWSNAAAGAGFLALGTLLGDVLLAVADPRVREDLEA